MFHFLYIVIKREVKGKNETKESGSGINNIRSNKNLIRFSKRSV